VEFKVKKEYIETAMSKIDAIVPAKDTQTLLSNVLLSTEENKLQITASDMESTVRVSMDTESSTSGELILRSKKLLEIARKIQTDVINFKAIKTEGENNEEHAYDISVQGDDKYAAKFKLQGNDKTHFPALNEISSVELSSIPSSVLDEMIKKTINSISQEDNRYIYSGLSFQADGNKLTIVGTDGKRLTAITRELETPIQLESQNDNDIVIHSKAIRELSRILDYSDVLQVGLFQRDIYFKVGDSELSSRLLEGKFPDYNKVIPQETTSFFIVNKEYLLKSISQVMVMTTKPSFQVKMILEDSKVILRANTPELGEAEIELDVQYKGNDLSINFNSTYLFDIINVLDTEEVKLCFIDEGKPVVIYDMSDNNYVSLIMPMKS